MNVIVCLDERDGMMFNGRRQSCDRILLEDMAKMTEGARLFASPYSERMLREYGLIPIVAEDFLGIAEQSDWCFLEDRALSAHADRLERLVIYRWNRHYPSDLTFDIVPEHRGLRLLQRVEFSGCSHDTITKEVFER